MPVRPARSISTKLVLLVLATVCLAIAVATAISLWQETNRYVRAKHEALLAVAHAFASAAAPSVAEGNPRGAFAALRGVADVPGVSFARIVTTDRKTLTQTGSVTRLQSDVEKRAPTAWNVLSSRSIEVSVPVQRAGRTVGELQLVGDTSELLGNLLGTLKATALGGLGALSVALLVALRLQRGITRPLRQLTRTMSSIRENHDYRARVDVESDDEVALLVDGFNAMLSEIDDRDARLEAHRKTLERDVAERTADLALARDAAEEASAAKSAFLATMSHEIRTPMNGVLVMAELLASADLPPREQRYAQVVAKSGHGLLAIINDILDFSKIESGKLELEERLVDPAALADEVVTLFAERARSKGLDLSAYVEPTTPAYVIGDPVRLNQVLGNLVNNALKFTDAGHVLLTVEPNVEGDGVRFAVQDTGIGIPEDKIGRLFETFSQADQSTTRRFGGTGLGLAISKRLVSAMGGAFQVTSTVGEGSIFAFTVGRHAEGEAREFPSAASLSTKPLQVCVAGVGAGTRVALSRYFRAAGHDVLDDGRDGDVADLIIQGGVEGPDDRPGNDARRILLQPMAAEEEPDGFDAELAYPLLYSQISSLLSRIGAGEPLRMTTGPETKRQAVPQYEGLKVLVADDSPVNREVMIETLSRFGIRADTVEDGLQAVGAVTEGTYELVFMDGSMPEIDGFEATRRIRAWEEKERRAGIPIIALTAHVFGMANDAWKAAGINAVVHKPFTLADIATCLAEHVGEGTGASVSDQAASPGVGNEAQASVPLVGNALPVLAQDVLRELDALAETGGAGVITRVFGLYLEHVPSSFDKLTAALAEGDLETVGAAAHAIKSMSYNIGASLVASAAGAIERTSRMEGSSPTEDDIQALSDALSETLAAVRHRQSVLSGEPTPASPDTGREDNMEAALLGAIARNELEVLYQPILERSSLRTACAEALLRWRWKGEAISPSVFIPVAEKGGSIVEIGAYVLRRVCMETKDLQIDAAVNVSPVQLQHPGFADSVERILNETGFAPSRLELEITEMALIEDEERAFSVIERLRGLGVRFALDDFGTGYSSLTYLQRLPVDKIKIDRTFVQSVEHSIHGATIIHAIVSIGRALGKKVVAEGVETEGEQRFLKAAGVHYLQGFRFARPMRYGQLLEHLEGDAVAPTREKAGQMAH